MRAPIAVALAVCLVSLVATAATRARADDDVEVYARVIVDSTIVRSGPGGGYRRVYRASRGDTFLVEERATRGYWFRIELPDGTSGWILGDHVYNHEVGEGEAGGGRFLPWLFAPPPLMDADGEISVNFGVLGGGGIMAVRPTFLLDPYFGIEATAAAAVAKGGRLLLGGLGGIVNLFPEAPIVPFVVVGGGFTITDPNADSFLVRSGNTGMLYGGGGIRIGFKHRFTIRLEARAYALYEPDRYVAQEEYSGGITVFF